MGERAVGALTPTLPGTPQAQVQGLGNLLLVLPVGFCLWLTSAFWVCRAFNRFSFLEVILPGAGCSMPPPHNP